MITNLISAHRNQNGSSAGGRAAPGAVILCVLEHATPSEPMFIPEYWAIRSHRAPNIGRRNVKQTIKRFRTFKGAATEFNKMCAFHGLEQKFAGDAPAQKSEVRCQRSESNNLPVGAGLAGDVDTRTAVSEAAAAPAGLTGYLSPALSPSGEGEATAAA